VLALPMDAQAIRVVVLTRSVDDTYWANKMFQRPKSTAAFSGWILIPVTPASAALAAPTPLF
jgi:hypothetical protein